MFFYIVLLYFCGVTGLLSIKFFCTTLPYMSIIREVDKALLLSQPSLTKSVKELTEQEQWAKLALVKQIAEKVW